MTPSVMGGPELFPEPISVNRWGNNGAGDGDGTESSGRGCIWPTISPNGRFVAFSSSATNLVSNKINVLPEDVFVRDLERKTTTLVSVYIHGRDDPRRDNGRSLPGVFSSDGRYLWFWSTSNELVPGDMDNSDDPFVRDLAAGVTVPINVNRSGAIIDDQSMNPRFSRDGRVMVFDSYVSDLVDNDNNGESDVFARSFYKDNAINDSWFFVSQHYGDFLNRTPDTPGIEFWRDQITRCGLDVGCLEVRKINVSAAFFLSIGFQQTGYLVYRAYNAGLNRANGLPRFDEFLRDTRAIGSGVVVGQEGWEQKLESNKQAFLDQFVAHDEFKSLYPEGMTPADYVDALFAHAGITPTAQERQVAIDEFTNPTGARARVLRRVAENQALTSREFNRAFVLMQYFGYLRRNPDDAPDRNMNGYNFWLNKLNQFGGNYITAEMVKAFITSDEYRHRFGN